MLPNIITEMSCCIVLQLKNIVLWNNHKFIGKYKDGTEIPCTLTKCYLWLYCTQLWYNIKTKKLIPIQYMCIALCLSNPPCHHHCNQDTELPSQQRSLSCYPFIVIASPLPTAIPNLGNHQSVVHLYNFVILRMLQKLHSMSYTVCDLLKWAFSTHHNALEIHPNRCIYK